MPASLSKILGRNTHQPGSHVIHRLHVLLQDIELPPVSFDIALGHQKFSKHMVSTTLILEYGWALSIYFENVGVMNRSMNTSKISCAAPTAIERASINLCVGHTTFGAVAMYCRFQVKKKKDIWCSMPLFIKTEGLSKHKRRLMTNGRGQVQSMRADPTGFWPFKKRRRRKQTILKCLYFLEEWKNMARTWVNSGVVLAHLMSPDGMSFGLKQMEERVCGEEE